MRTCTLQTWLLLLRYMGGGAVVWLLLIMLNLAMAGITIFAWAMAGDTGVDLFIHVSQPRLHRTALHCRACTASHPHPHAHTHAPV